MLYQSTQFILRARISFTAEGAMARNSLDKMSYSQLTGRGRMPRWMVAATKGSKAKKEDFLIRCAASMGIF